MQSEAELEFSFPLMSDQLKHMRSVVKSCLSVRLSLCDPWHLDSGTVKKADTSLLHTYGTSCPPFSAQLPSCWIRSSEFSTEAGGITIKASTKKWWSVVPGWGSALGPESDFMLIHRSAWTGLQQSQGMSTRKFLHLNSLCAC